MGDLEKEQVIAFKLSDKKYAVPIINLPRIFLTQKTMRMSATEEYAKGLKSLQIAVIPVMDNTKITYLNKGETYGK